jgi:uncharacterized protein YfaS (alpha-2-macroglobulin family)
MRLRFVLTGLLLTLALSAPAQEDEAQAYFSLNSDQPVLPGGTAKVRLQASGVQTLQFRLYRVNDTVAFFQKLENPHNFGGNPNRRAPVVRTPLEKFRAWKHRLRSGIRDMFRAQFSEENRAAIRARMEGRSTPAGRTAPATADYAAIPVLNPQQLIKTWEVPIRSANRWEASTVDVPLEASGTYLLEATDGKLQAYTVLFATRIALITKSAPGRLMVRVVDRVKGAPLAGVPVVLVDSGKKAEIGRLKTAADGLAQFELKTASPQGLTVFALAPADTAVANVYGWALTPDQQRSVGYIYTDRPVYRPGHTVHFKAIVRVESAGGYELPNVKELPVEINDPEGKTVLRKSLPLTALGSVSGDLPLGGDAPLGYYSINVRDAMGGAGGGFHVEEYRKPEYEVRVVPEKPRLFQGEAMKLRIEAKYFYGEPVAGAKVTYVVHRSRYWPPYWEEQEMEEGGDNEDGFWGEEQLTEESGKLDKDGRLTVSVPTDHHTFEYRYRVEARVTDASQREIRGAGYFLATQASCFLWARAENYVATAGEKTHLVVEARDFDGNAAASLPFDIEVIENFQNKTGTTVATLSGKTDAGGRGAVEYIPPKAGSFKLVARAKDSGGRETVSEGYMWVSGTTGWSWGGGAERITLVPDKKSYKPGETAKVLLVTGGAGCDVWLTTEGKTIHTSRFVKLQGASNTVSIPITSAYQPNVYLEAACVRDNVLLRGSKSLSVPAFDKKLKLSVTTAKKEYKPGEEAVFSVEARDWQDKPVAAELSLGIVDEAIYAVKPEPGGGILNAFYGRNYNRIGTESSFNYMFWGEAGKRRMQLARLRPSSGLGQIKPERLAEARVRKAFPDTLFWTAHLNTGSDGRGQVKVEFPDALTQWRATARGVTADTKVGSTLERTTVRKNVILTLATPRFLTENDHIFVPFIVRNYLQNEVKIRASLDVKGAELLDRPAAEFTVASRGESKQESKMSAGEGDSVVLLGKALSEQESDALELTVPVQPAGLKLADARGGALKEGTAKTALQLDFPAASTPHTRDLSIQITPSLAGALFGALEYLSTYPYGCTEQTMSSFLPNVIVTRAANELGLPLKMQPGELQRRVRAGLERLYDFQAQDGGWGYWRGDESEPFITAYVTYGLQEARNAGYNVREQVLSKAAQALDAQWKNAERYKPDLKAYMLYSLATTGRYDRSRWEDVWKEQRELSPMGLALMGLTAQLGKDPRADSIAGMLESSARKEGTEAWWKADRDDLMDFYWDISTEATAYAVKFLSLQRPNSSLLPGAVQWLIAHRNGGYYWSSTKQTAMVVYGLTDYLKQSGELKPEFTASVTINGRKALEKHFGAADALNPEPALLKIRGSSEKNSIEVVKNGSGVLYWSARADYYSRQAAESSTGGELSVRREYYKLVPVTESGRIVYNLETLNGPAKVGDTLAVRLVVKGADWKYLLIEDSLPAGAETVKDDNLYELKNRPYEWDYWYERREMRDNRAVWYDRWFPKGKKHYVYLLKLTHAGTFQVNPTRVEPMYQPGVLASSEGFTLEVQP